MRWSRSDTAGFVIAATILIVPPVAVQWYAHEVFRKPNSSPITLTTYAATAGIGLLGAVVSSALAWRFGGSESGRWAIHGLVASVMLVTFVIGCCFWPR